MKAAELLGEVTKFGWRIGARSRVVSASLRIAPWLLLASSATRNYAQADFALKSNDVVVFYGDSITEQDLYTQFTELYTTTRFPALHISFFGAGVGGDRVSGGGGGPVDTRLRRDVFAYKPSVVTVMLGMNDGGYKPPSPATEATYTSGYRHILNEIQANAPGARVTLLGPSPFDDVTRPPRFSGGYNATQRRFSDIDRTLAAEDKASFVDLNAPVVDVLRRAQASDPAIAQLLIPDRIHPEAVVHWVMAMALLKSWNAPAEVSDVRLNAATGAVQATERATVTEVRPTEGGLTWTALEGALPLPLDPNNGNDALLMKLTGIETSLNREMLTVSALQPGSYALAIDGHEVGVFTAEQLRAGVNLAEYGTPMRGQAQGVAWAVRDRDRAHYIHRRLQIDRADTGVADGLLAYEETLQKRIWDQATPKPHQFSLRPAKGAAGGAL